MISLVQKERFDLEEKTRDDGAVILSALQFHLNVFSFWFSSKTESSLQKSEPSLKEYILADKSLLSLQCCLYYDSQTICFKRKLWGSWSEISKNHPSQIESRLWLLLMICSRLGQILLLVLKFIETVKDLQMTQNPSDTNLLYFWFPLTRKPM